MSRLRAFKADLIVLAGFLLLPLLLYSSVTIGGRTMLPADNLFQWQPWASHAAELGVETAQNSLISDLILQNYPWRRFIRQSLQAGELPLWNPYLFAGAPFLATGQHSAYYPFSLIFLVLPLPQAYGWYTVSQLWLAAVFIYLFGRVLGLRRSSSAMAGLVYQGSGFLLVSAAVFPMIIAAAIWLPLLLACIERIVRHSTAVNGSNDAGKTLPWAVLGAVALGNQILAGHVEITYYTLLVMAAYTAWRLARQALALLMPAALYQRANVDSITAAGASGAYRPGAWATAIVKPAAWLLSMVAMGLMLGAIQFVPLYEVASTNFREGSATLAEVRNWAFPKRQVVTLALPNFFGNPSHHHYLDAFTGERIPFTTNVHGELNPHGANSSSWGIKNYVEGGIYFGILPLFLLLLGAWSVWHHRPDRRSHVAFFLILSLFSLAFIFGTPLYALLYYGLPGINQLHSPFRWVFPLSLCVALLAGYGMDYLRAVADLPSTSSGDAAASMRRARWSRRNGEGALAAILAGLAVWGGLLLLGALFISRVFYDHFEPAFERLFMSLSLASDAFPHTRAFYSYQLPQLILLALVLVGAGLALYVTRSRISLAGRPLYLSLAAAVVVLDLLAANYGFNAAVDPTLLAYKPAMAQWLEQQPGLWRLTSFTPHGDKPFNANAGWHFNLQDVRGYDSIIPKQYTEYMAAIEPQQELLYNRVQPISQWQSLNSPLLDLLGVRYVITAETVALPKLQLAWEGEGLRVYENLGAMPRAFTLPQTATAVVEDPLAAMADLDPRHYVIIATGEWPAKEVGTRGTLATAGSSGPATVTVYRNNEVWVDTAVDEAAWLVLADSHFAGWRVFVRPWGGDQESEQEAALVRVNGNFRGVLLEPGSWTVRFRYSPLSFRVGGLASFLAGVILLFAFVTWGWRRLYNPQWQITNTRSLAKNSLVPMTLNLFNRGIDFVFAAFYLRFLGPAEAGSYATAIAIAGWFEIVSNFGLNTLVIRDVSQDKSRAARYLLNSTLLRLGTSLVACLPIFVYVWGRHQAGAPLSQEMVAAIALFMVGMVFSGMSQGVAGLFYAYEQAEWPAAIATMTTILKVGFGVLVLLLGFGFVGLAAVSIVVNVITLLILAVAAWRLVPLGGGWRVDLRLQGRMVQLSYPLMLNHFFAVIFFQIDIPILQQIRGETEAGWYNSAYKWVNAINVVPSFFTFALFPIMARQVQSSIDDVRRTFRMSIKLLLLVALPIAVLTTFLAPLLIQMLGGRAYLPHGAIALQLVIWSIPFGWLNSVTNYVLIALGRERVLTKAFLVGVTFNVVANLIFIPHYGYAAAAVTTILSEIVLLAVFGLYLRPRLPNVGWFGVMWRPALVTVVTLAAMLLALQLHLALAMVAGLFFYPAGLWLLGVFGAEERRILNSLLPASLATRLRLA
jgi:O-antigen/teichoic acid export membrane protein